jgi:methylated-DNA-[protein]-cysteine S-methyltransferase
VAGRACGPGETRLEQDVTGRQSYTVFKTPSGYVALAWTARGVSGLRLPTPTEQAAQAAILTRLPSAERTAPGPAVGQLIADIVRYFEGERVDFSDVSVDLGSQTPFFSNVYSEIRKLGWGQTTTYGSVAKALGAEPQGARDVGQAMAANPVPLIVPCHRVLAAGGKIGGFSAPGGSNSKARMLEIEGVTVADKASDTQGAPPTQASFSF